MNRGRKRSPRRQSDEGFGQHDEDTGLGDKNSDENLFSTREFAWGEGVLSDGKVLVVDGEKENGYRCPICEVNFKQKRKEVMKKHFDRAHKDLGDIDIPCMKEKCQFCQKALDPKKSKRILHLKVCKQLKKKKKSKVKEEINNNPHKNPPEDWNSEDEPGEDQTGEDQKGEDQTGEVQTCEDQTGEWQLDKGQQGDSQPGGVQPGVVQVEAEDALEHVRKLVEEMSAFKEKYDEAVTEVYNLNELLAFERIKSKKEKEKLELMIKKLTTNKFENEKAEAVLKDEMMKDVEDIREKYTAEVEEVVKLKESLILEKSEAQEKTKNLELMIKEEKANSKETEENLKAENKKLKKEVVDLERQLKEESKLKKETSAEMKEMKQEIIEIERKLKEEKKSKEEMVNKYKQEKSKRIQQNHILQKLSNLNLKEVEFGKKLGEGEFGAVYLAKNGSENIAIKIANKIEAESITECMVMIKLQDVPNVMSATSIYIDPTRILISMKMMDTDLDKYIKSRGSDEETEWRRIVIRGAAIGVKNIHDKNIMHCDIKPANFLVQIKNDLPHVFLADFGSANIGLKAKGYVGSPGYIAPEMYLSPDYEYNELIDEWSLGATLFEVMTGEDMVLDDSELRKPKQRWNKCKVDMPPEVSAIKKLLSINPKRRSSCENFLKMIT